MKKTQPVIVGTSKNEYGPGTPPMLSHVFEGPHGYENIIGEDEIPPTGLDSLPAREVRRKSQKGRQAHGGVMARHDASKGDDGAQAGGYFPALDTPMNVSSEGGAAPASNNLVPTAEFPDPLGLKPGGKGAKEIGPKG